MDVLIGVLYNLLIAVFVLALVGTPFLCSICFACKMDKKRKSSMAQ